MQCKLKKTTRKNVNTSVCFIVKSGYNVPSKGHGCDIFVVFEFISKAKYILLLILNEKSTFEFITIGRRAI